MARKKKTNPHGANQYVVDPRQALFLSYYFDPKSETFSNGLQSALKAGFSEEYSKVIIANMPTWLSEKIKDTQQERMLQKAERNLDELLDLPSVTQAMGAFGPIFDKKTKKPIMVLNPSLLKLKRETSEFVAERLGKNKYGAKGNGAVQLEVNVYTPEQVKRVAARVLYDEAAGEQPPDRLRDSDESEV